MNFVLGVPKAPTMHHGMTISQRVQSSMEGFLVLDLYKVIAEISTSRNGFPRGSQFISHKRKRICN